MILSFINVPISETLWPILHTLTSIWSLFFKPSSSCCSPVLSSLPEKDNILLISSILANNSSIRSLFAETGIIVRVVASIAWWECKLRSFFSSTLCIPSIFLNLAVTSPRCTSTCGNMLFRYKTAWRVITRVSTSWLFLNPSVTSVTVKRSNFFFQYSNSIFHRCISRIHWSLRSLFCALLACPFQYSTLRFKRSTLSTQRCNWDVIAGYSLPSIVIALS